jgi:peptidoglycan/xylan/chitin deacetylase (PgdA/CDA1 family)
MSRVKQIVKRSGVVLDRIVPPPTGITILIYHRVGGGSESQVDLDPAMFRRQLEHLAEHHRVLSLDAAVAELTAGTPQGWANAPDPANCSSGLTPGAAPARNGNDLRRGVVITFDDGTADFTDVVVPALDRNGLPATLYLATRFVDEATDFPWGAPPTSWPALRDSLDTGNVTIASHTHSHRLLDRLDPADVSDDLDRSIELIGEHLGVDARHFAYPKAVLGSPSAEIAVRQRFATAALARSRVNRPARTDLHRLWRTPVQRSDGFDTFTRKANGGLRLEGELRSLTARSRYRGADR